jgi:transcription elongation factor SPT5
MFLDERNERNEPREEFDPSKTPLHRPGDTPIRAATPHRPSTPSHDPFNPQGSQTPSYHPSPAYLDEGYDATEDHPTNFSAGNSSSYSRSNNEWETVPTPGTPGAQFDHSYREEPHIPHTPHTPGGDMYSHPQTPSGDPYQTPHTPGDSYSIQTPHTPGGDMYPPATPVLIVQPSTPAVPGTPGIFNDSGYNDDSDDESLPSGWVMPLLEVLIDETYPNPRYSNQIGQIISVDGDVCTLRLRNGEIKTNAAYLVPVRPEKNDRVRVLKGKSKGQTGIIKSTDDKEGVVQIDDKEIKVLKLHCLAKMVAPVPQPDNDW